MLSLASNANDHKEIHHTFTPHNKKRTTIRKC